MKSGRISISEVHTMARSSSRSVQRASLEPLAALELAQWVYWGSPELTTCIVGQIIVEFDQS
jgi:hypothetical protein